LNLCGNYCLKKNETGSLIGGRSQGKIAGVNLILRSLAIL